ncbi:enoyl-CoA hydratase family protein [Nitriliruptor alkaliphilus]|uniref:enoyl-CoA hydratase family protein n=1 Tax=Nitriliruptor alkaliphilus TaxID=427918 RepID=UPI0006961E7C|nr:enoyl-CoA hydratase family protein [Nitriliruptor alkaliphilus]
MTRFRASAPFTADWQHFRFEVHEGVGVLTFDRPDRLNALTLDVYADLRDLLAELEHRDDVHALVLTGEGRGFCSGGDVEDIIGELLDHGDNRRVTDFTRMTGAVVRNLRELPIPVIAAINGTTAGAGAVIALAADLRIMARPAAWHFLFTKVGLAGADMGCAYLLPRVIGFGRAMELLLFGDRLDAETAERYGLVNRVVEPDEVLPEALAWARRLADGPTFAIAATKKLLTREQDVDLSSAIELEAFTQAFLMRSEDHAEFLAANRERRDPTWTGR